MNEYSLAHFQRNLPQLHACLVLDEESEIYLHAARWRGSVFQNLAEFFRYTSRCSSVIQPFIYSLDRDEIADWFCKDEQADARADAYREKQGISKLSARQWMNEFYPSFVIDWLTSGAAGEIISWAEGEWPEMAGCDLEGYFHVFAADRT